MQRESSTKNNMKGKSGESISSFFQTKTSNKVRKMDSPTYMDSPSHDRNPSPPPELVEHSELLREESIGNTAFSKHWLFTTLMKLIEEVDRENQESADADLLVDVDEELQNELCKLWDMSMNADVAQFLNEFKAIEILSGIIEKSKAPRVTEICVGILGNMACEASVCRQISENSKFVNLMLLLLENGDAPTLVENTRLIYTSLSNTGARSPWIRAIQRSEDVLGHLKFIFVSSTKWELLKNTAELVDILLDLEPDLCVSWATEEFIHSLLEATEQIGSNHSDAFEVYLHIFQSFSTTENGVEALVHHRDRLEKKILKYLDIVCEYEIVGLGGKEEPLASALSVINILVSTHPRNTLAQLCNNERLMRVILKILEPLYPMLKKYKEEDQSTSVNVNGNQSASNQPISEVDSDHVTSSDQSEQCDADSTAVIEPDGTVGEDNAECEGKTTDGGLSEEDRKEMKQLEILYEILRGFLMDYCSIIFIESKASNGEDKISTITTTESGDHVRVFSSGDTNDTMKPDSSGLAESREDGPGSTGLENVQAGKEAADVKTNGKESVCVDTDRNESTEQETDRNKSESSDIKGSKFVVDTSETKETEAKEERDRASATIDVVPILTYLDEACSRCRLNYFALTLKETEAGVDLFTQIFDLCRQHDMQRLLRVFGDVAAGKIVSRAYSSRIDESTVT